MPSCPTPRLISSSEAPDDIPDVSIEARIGDGATGTVYAGCTSRPVARSP